VACSPWICARVSPPLPPTLKKVNIHTGAENSAISRYSINPSTLRSKPQNLNPQPLNQARRTSLSADSLKLIPYTLNSEPLNSEPGAENSTISRNALFVVATRRERCGFDSQQRNYRREQVHVCTYVYTCIHKRTSYFVDLIFDNEIIDVSRYTCAYVYTCIHTCTLYIVYVYVYVYICVCV